MVTFKAIVLKHHAKTDGTYNVKIRVTHGRKAKYINTNFAVTKNDITESFKLKNHFFIDEMVKG